MSEEKNVKFVEASIINKKLNWYLIKILIFKMLQGLLFVFLGWAIPPTGYFFIKMLLKIPAAVVYLVSGSDILISFKFFFYFILFVNGIELIRRLVKNYPLVIFNLDSVAENFFATKDISIGGVRTLIIGFWKILFTFAGRFVADGIYLFLQGWLLLFSKGKYAKILIILTQSETPLSLDLISAVTEIPNEILRKRLESLMAGMWVLETKKGFKITTSLREKLDPNYETSIMLKKKIEDNNISAVDTTNEISRLYKDKAMAKDDLNTVEN